MFDYFIYTYGPTLAMMVLCAIFGTLGHAAKRIYVNHINDSVKRSIAAAAVRFVEQAWNVLRGPDKLKKALDTARGMLEKKGIDFDPEEMTVLIEAAVAEFNDAFQKPMEAEVTRCIGFSDCDDREESGLLEE